MSGNMYAGVEPINELGGHCKHNCLYCSTIFISHIFPATKMKYSGEYRLYQSVLKRNLKGNQVIFVCGQNDLFEESVPEEMIDRILERACNRDQSNLYMFQTKNPARFKDYLDQLPEMYMLGTTIETNREEYIEKYSDAPSIKSRVDAMVLLSDHPTYVTIEPILDFDHDEFVALLKLIHPNKIFIGSDSKVHKYPRIYHNLKLPEPDGEKVLKLIKALEEFTEVEQKENLKRLINKGSGKDGNKHK